MLRKIVIVTAILIAILIAYNLIVQIMSAMKSGDRLSDEANKVYKLEIQNKELKQQLSQIKSPEFIEQQARDKLGLGREGETVVIIPDDKLKLVLGATSSAQTERLPNPLGWLRLFFR